MMMMTKMMMIMMIAAATLPDWSGHDFHDDNFGVYCHFPDFYRYIMFAMIYLKIDDVFWSYNQCPHRN